LAAVVQSGFGWKRLLQLLRGFHLLFSTSLSVVRLLLRSRPTKYIRRLLISLRDPSRDNKKKPVSTLPLPPPPRRPPRLLPQQAAAACARAPAPDRASPSSHSLPACRRRGWARTRQPPRPARGQVGGTPGVRHGRPEGPRQSLTSGTARRGAVDPRRWLQAPLPPGSSALPPDVDPRGLDETLA